MLMQDGECVGTKAVCLRVGVGSVPWRAAGPMFPWCETPTSGVSGESREGERESKQPAGGRAGGRPARREGTSKR